MLSAARLLKEAGTRELHLLTSQGSNPGSWLLYPSTKGKVGCCWNIDHPHRTVQVEVAAKELQFPRLSIYRPGLLLCQRENKRTFGNTPHARFLTPHPLGLQRRCSSRCPGRWTATTGGASPPCSWAGSWWPTAAGQTPTPSRWSYSTVYSAVLSLHYTQQVEVLEHKDIVTRAATLALAK